MSKKMREKKEKKEKPKIKRILQNNLYSFKFMWDNSKIYLFTQLFHATFNALVSPIWVILTSMLFNMLDRGASFKEAITIIIIMAVLETVNTAWNWIYGRSLVTKYQQELHYRYQSKIFEKVRTIELSRYDDPEFYNNFIQSLNFSDSIMMSTITNFASMLGSVLTIVSVMGVILYVDLTVALIVLGSTVISMIIRSKYNKIEFKKNMDFTPIIRKGQYITRMYNQADYAKELRITELHKNLDEAYDKNTEDYNNLAKAYGKKKVLMDIIEGLNGESIYIAVIAVVLYKMMVKGSVLLGGLTVVINSNWQFSNAMMEFAGNILAMPEQSMYIDRLRAFLEYTPSTVGGSLDSVRFETLELKNISFAYTGGEDVIKDVSLKINRGEKIAFVGYNGAGKTTLIKLIMHLYEVDKGCIYYNGVNIREINTKSYQARIGAVFQDYRIFAATLAENILGDEYTPEQEFIVKNAIEMATFDSKFTDLENGLDTMLTREFDESGTNLSGGEAQKVAIARVFAHPFDLIIMDEPSSALDPVAEYNLNRHISEFASDKTAIFISHRLSTTRHVDRIYMFEDGRIVEFGSHDELMRLGGKYAEMFNVQAKNYIEE